MGKLNVSCPMCDRLSLVAFNKPIDYWCCTRCGDIFVIGKDGTVSALNTGCSFDFKKHKKNLYR